MEKILNRIVSVIYYFIMLLILAVVIFEGRMEYSPFHRRTFFLPNIILMAIGIAAVFLLRRLVNKGAFSFKNKYVLPGVFLVVTIVLSICCMYLTGWDAGTLIDDAFNWATTGNLGLGYYSENPNNRLIFVVMASILKFGMGLGITGKPALYGLWVIVQCLLFWLTGFIVKDIILRITRDDKTALFGYLLYNLFVGMSPWLVVVYTDCMGFIFPALTLWLYLIIPDDTSLKKIVKWLVLLFVGLLGYQIKTTTFVMYIALLMALFISSFGEKKKSLMALGLAIFAINVITLVPAFIKCWDFIPGTIAFEAYTGEKCDREAELMPWHYFMMGLNKESDGTFNYADDAFSHYIDTSDYRVEREKKVIVERLSDLGFSGLVKLYSKKLVIDYNDGSFGYGLTGGDFVTTQILEDAPWNVWARYIFMPGRGGFSIYLNYVHILWLSILAFCLFHKIRDRYECAIAFGLIGITMFLLLFESQQRYLLVFAPIFVIAGVLGSHNVLSRK